MSTVGGKNHYLGVWSGSYEDLVSQFRRQLRKVGQVKTYYLYRPADGAVIVWSPVRVDPTVVGSLGLEGPEAVKVSIMRPTFTVVSGGKDGE